MDTKHWEYFHTQYKEILKGYYGRGCAISCGDGWYDLLDRVLEELHLKLVAIDSVVTDIKEKYGTLRIYVSYDTDEIFDIIAKAEEESSKICEICGKPGEIRDFNGWLATLCTTHYMQQFNGKER